MATYYWVGGSGTWDNVSNTNWSASSGGAGGAGVPNNTDTVNFDANSGTAATVTVAATAACLNCTINKSDITLQLSGNATLGVGAGLFVLTAGTLDINSNVLTVAIFQSNTTNARTIAFGASGKIVVTGNNNAGLWYVSGANATLTGNRLVEFTYSGGVGTRNIRHGYASVYSEANSISVNITAGTDTVVFSVDGFSALNNVSFSGFTGTFDFGFSSSIYGNLTLASGTTPTANTNPLVFVGTGSKTITSNGASINCPVTFNGVGGTWTLQDNMTVGSTRTVTLTNGTLDLNNNTLSTGLFASSNSNARTIAFGTGNITLTGNNATIWNMATATNFTYTGTPTVNATYSGSTGTRTFTNGTVAGLSESNVVNLNVTAGTDIFQLATSAGVKNLNFTGFAGSLANATRTIYGNLTLSTGMTVTDGTNGTVFASASGTQTITSNGITFNAAINIGSATAFPTVELADALNTGTRNIFVIAGTFDTKGYNVTCATLQTAPSTAYTKAIKLNNSTVTLSGNIIFSFPNNFTFDAGTSSIVLTSATPTLNIYYNSDYTFYNVSFTNSAITQSSWESRTLTFNNLSFPNATTTSYYLFVNADITVNGTLTLPSGSSYINRTGFYSSKGSIINAAAISGTLTDVDFRGITVTGPTAPWTGTRLGNGGGNSGITGFEAPKTVYWSLAAGGNWSATAWATSSGGTPAVANYPILGDTVIFDNAGLNTSATVTVDRAFAINNLDFSARSNAMTLAGAAGQRFVNGNFTASSGITFSATFTLNIGPWSGTSTFTSAGRTISFFIAVTTGSSGNVVFADNVTSTSTFNPIAGNIDLNGKTFSFTQIQPVRSIISVINLNGATITCTGTSPFAFAANVGAAGYKTFIGTCTANCSSASAKTIINGTMTDLSGFTFVNTGAGALTFQNTVTPGFNDGQYGTYGDIQTTVRPATINFTAGQTFQFNNFTISGTSGNLVTLQSSTAGTQATLLSPNTVNSVSFCSIKDLNAINTMGYGEWRAYTTNGNVDAGNNTGWLFSPATPSTAPRPTIRLRSLAQRGNMT